MILILIGICIGLYFGFRIMVSDAPIDGWFDPLLFMCLLMTLIFGAIGGFVGSAPAALIGAFLPTDIYQSAQTDIVALRDNNGAEGRFFLGTGQIKDEMYYMHYYKCGDSCFAFGKLSARDAVVIEDGNHPHIAYFRKRFKDPRWLWVALPSFCDCLDAEFHIPKGSVKQGFSLDLN